MQAAAKTLGVNQSTVQRRIAELEDIAWAARLSFASRWPSVRFPRQALEGAARRAAIAQDR